MAWQITRDKFLSKEERDRLVKATERLWKRRRSSTYQSDVEHGLNAGYVRGYGEDQGLKSDEDPDMESTWTPSAVRIQQQRVKG